MEASNEAVEKSTDSHPERQAFKALGKAVNELIIGQERLMERLTMALLCHGHLLVEGAPGLAKTTAIKVLAERIEGDFHRIQFTPDLLPADLTGTEIYRPQEGSFEKFSWGLLVLYPLVFIGVISVSLKNLMVGLGGIFSNQSAALVPDGNVIAILYQLNTLIIPSLAPILVWAWQSRDSAMLQHLSVLKPKA